MRLFKRILVVVALLLVVGLLVTAGGMWMAYDTPEWYHPQGMTDAQRAAAAARMEDAWAEAQTRLAEAHARQMAATTQKLVNGEPAPPVRISFSADELNAFFDKWSKLNHWEEKFEQYLADPQIVLHEGRLILAGKLKQVELVGGLVASVHFRPHITDDGELNLELVKVLGGNLPMPEGLWAKQKQRLTAAVRARLPQWQRQARVDPQGMANSEAVTAAMSKLFLQTMDHGVSEPVAFIPLVGQGSFPVRVIAIEITAEAGTDEPRLTLTVEAMTPTERAAFLDRLRAPQRATASVE